MVPICMYMYLMHTVRSFLSFEYTTIYKPFVKIFSQQDKNLIIMRFTQQVRKISEIHLDFIKPRHALCISLTTAFFI